MNSVLTLASYSLGYDFTDEVDDWLASWLATYAISTGDVRDHIQRANH